jgi:hypothetical protein
MTHINCKTNDLRLGQYDTQTGNISSHTLSRYQITIQEAPQCNETRFSTTKYRHLSRIQLHHDMSYPQVKANSIYYAETELLFLATVTLTRDILDSNPRLHLEISYTNKKFGVHRSKLT